MKAEDSILNVQDDNFRSVKWKCTSCLTEHQTCIRTNIDDFYKIIETKEYCSNCFKLHTIIFYPKYIDPILHSISI